MQRQTAVLAAEIQKFEEAQNNSSPEPHTFLCSGSVAAWVAGATTLHTRAARLSTSSGPHVYLNCTEEVRIAMIATHQMGCAGS
jgi:hypothetical protein